MSSYRDSFRDRLPIQNDHRIGNDNSNNDNDNTYCMLPDYTEKYEKDPVF